MSILCFKLEQIPDLTLTKYQSLGDTGVKGVLMRHESFLRQWHGICKEFGVSMHLLYTFLTACDVGSRLKVYFMLQGEEAVLKVLEPLLKKSPLSDFFTLRKTRVPRMSFVAGATLTKNERETPPIYNPKMGTTDKFHYVPKMEMNDAARLYDLMRMMETIGQSYASGGDCAYRVDLYPVSMVQDTRAHFMPIIKKLRGQNEIELLRETDSIRKDEDARDLISEYEDWQTEIETTPHFRMNIYGFADDLFKAKILLNAAGSEAVDEGNFSILPIKPDENGIFETCSRMGNAPVDYCSFRMNPEAFKSWSTTYCLREVVPFFRFPTLHDGETVELPKETAPDLFSDGIYIGKDTNGYPVNFASEHLPRHAFFTGMPGSGKTNTMLQIVSELHKKGVPFLVMEPAKKEYRALLGRMDMRDVYLFSPHLQSKFPLQMNPLAFPKGVRLSEHINALLEVFQGSFVLEGPIYKFLGGAIERSYTALNWDIEDINPGDGSLKFPTLTDVYENLEKEINASSYDGELKGNMRSFLQVRLGSLMERDAGELFNVEGSTIAPGDWLTTSAIVELEVLNEQAKNFFVLLICHYVLETLRVDPTGGVDRFGSKLPVRHAIFIEEAHNIIAPTTRQSGGDSVDPKISATAYIVKMLAEVRALREAIIISDQLPTALAPEVTKNTGLKLVHRLTAQDDRGQIGAAISASPVQLERMASLTVGRAFIHHEKTMKPFEVQIAPWPAPKGGVACSDDELLYSEIAMESTMQRAVYVWLINWNLMYVRPLLERVYGLNEQLENVKSENSVAWTLFKNDRDVCMGECIYLRKKLEKKKQLWQLPVKAGPRLAELLSETEDRIAFIYDSLQELGANEELGE